MSLIKNHASDDSKFCKPENLVHLLIGFLLIALSFAFLFFSCDASYSKSLVLSVDLYLVVLLLEVAMRPSASQHWIFAIPHRSWSVLLVGFLLASFVFGYGNLYLKSRGVYHLVVETETPAQTGQGEMNASHTHYECLSDWVDAIYFSSVTMTTLGYGDYFPATREAEKLVVWQLASGVLLLLIAIPTVASRLALLGSG